MNTVSETFSELRSEEVQELLTRPPKWLLRWGITVVFLIVLLIFGGAYLIHYPDLVKAPFKLTSGNAPKIGLARTDGKLVRLLIHEGQYAKSGTALLYLESTARHSDVLHLSNQLAKAWAMASKGNLEGLNWLNFSRYNQMGELQVDYQTFEQSYIQLQAYLSDGFYSKKKVLLQQEIQDLSALAENLREQRQIQAQDMELAQKDLEIQSKLARDKVISPLDLNREQSKNIARKLPFQQTASSLISNVTAQRAKQKEILELDKQVTEERGKFLHALNTLQSAIDKWKAKYILTSPVDGRVFFVSSLQENQSVALNQELFYVSPISGDYFGELRIRQQNAGKVQVGQSVLIKFAGYPYQEFGIVRGRITRIADVPLKDTVFLAKVELPNGLKTSFGKKLVYKNGLSASAEIITDDSRLLEKLFYQLRKLINIQ